MLEFVLVLQRLLVFVLFQDEILISLSGWPFGQHHRPKCGVINIKIHYDAAYMQWNTVIISKWHRLTAACACVHRHTLWIAFDSIPKALNDAATAATGAIRFFLSMFFFSLIFSAIEKSWKNLKSFIAISFFFMYTDVKHIFSKFLPFQQRIKENRIKKTVIVTGDREWKAREKNANEWNGVQTSKMRFGGGSRHRK